MPTSKLEEQLSNIFNNVNDWLKFAEAKNAAIIVFNTAAVIGVIEGVKNEDIASCLKGGMLVMFLISTCVGLFSFIPKLNKMFSPTKLEDSEFKTKKESLNCFYFKHISKLTTLQFTELLIFKCDLTNQTPVTGLEKDIASQIVTNSEITIIKFRDFSIATWFTGAGIVIGLVAIIINSC